jgi:hypothetical protein
MMAEKKAGRREGVWEVGGLRVSRRIRDSGGGLAFWGLCCVGR